jgi:hypothetical protein
LRVAARKVLLASDVSADKTRAHQTHVTREVLADEFCHQRWSTFNVFVHLYMKADCASRREATCAMEILVETEVHVGRAQMEVSSVYVVLVIEATNVSLWLILADQIHA